MMALLERPELIAALAALIGAIGYALRGRTDTISRLVRSLTKRIESLEAEVASLRAENRHLRWAVDAVRDEYEEFRAAVSSGAAPPMRENTNPRVQIAAREEQ